MEQAFKDLREQLLAIEKRFEEVEKLYNCKGPDTVQ